MRLKAYFRWELVLALSLVGCTSVVPNRLGLPQLTQGGTSDATSAIAKKGSLFFQVRWPERGAYRAQEIPTETETIEVHVKATDGTPIDSKVIPRPSGASSVSDVAFELDPTLKVVDIFVRGLNAAGQEVAFGKKLGVLIRDNTATGVTVTLKSGDATQTEQELQLELNRKIALLHDVRNYFNRFDHFNRFHESVEARDVKEAMESILQNAPFKPQGPRDNTYYPTPDPNYSPPAGTEGGDPTRTATGYVIRSFGTIGTRVTDGTIRLSNPNDPSQYMDILNGELKKLYWTGYALTPSYSDAGGGRHTAGVAIAPFGEGGNGSMLDLNVEVTAGTWVAEPSLTVTLDGNVNNQPGTATFTLLGGLKPEERTLSQVKVAGSLTPKGNEAGKVHSSVLFDTFRDVSGSPLYQLFKISAPRTGPIAPAPYPGGSTGTYPGGSTGTYADSPATGGSGGNYGDSYFLLPSFMPTNARFLAHVPSAQATTDVRVTDDMLGVQSRTELRLRDNANTFSNFLLELGVTTQVGAIGGQPAIVSGDFGFSLVDQKEALKLEGVVHGDMAARTVTVKARFVDVPSNTVLGNLDWTFEPNGDPNHLAYWPVLHLQDGTEHRLTPGFFSGETTGNVRVDVR